KLSGGGSRACQKSGRHFAVCRIGPWFWNWLARCAETLNVKPDSVAHFPLDFRSSSAGGPAPWQIGGIGRKNRCGSPDDNQVTAHLSPACLKILSALSIVSG